MTAGVGEAQFFQRVLDTCPDLLCVYDLGDQQIIWCNKAATVTLGVRAEELPAGADVVERFLEEPERALLGRAIKQVTAKADRDFVSLRLATRDRDGLRRWLSGRLAPFRRDDA